MTVAELECRLSLREYYDWMEFTSLEPFPAERVDLAGALISSTMVNMNRRKGAPAAKVDDFMLVSQGLRADAEKAEEAKLDPADAHLRRVILGLGGRVS